MNDRQKVIIDCDPGIDDSLALMLALTSPELEVVGITTVPIWVLRMPSKS